MATQTLRKHGGFFLATGLTVLVLLLLGLMLAKRRGLFEEKLHLRFQTESGVGLHKGMAVMFAGFRVGTLERVELGRDGAIGGEIEVLA
ncbi:MAG: MCE family protein [Candidatus Protistobacter heckmanni]|nr:MCE family protein [Candidatus Protistobacter heckmanni]